MIGQVRICFKSSQFELLRDTITIKIKNRFLGDADPPKRKVVKQRSDSQEGDEDGDLDLPEHDVEGDADDIHVDVPEPIIEDDTAGGDADDRLGEDRADDEDADADGLGLGLGKSKKKLTNAFNFCERAALTCNNPTRVGLTLSFFEPIFF